MLFSERAENPERHVVATSGACRIAQPAFEILFDACETVLVDHLQKIRSDFEKPGLVAKRVGITIG